MNSPGITNRRRRPKLPGPVRDWVVACMKNDGWIGQKGRVHGLRVLELLELAAEMEQFAAYRDIALAHATRTPHNAVNILSGYGNPGKVFGYEYRHRAVDRCIQGVYYNDVVRSYRVSVRRKINDQQLSLVRNFTTLEQAICFRDRLIEELEQVKGGAFDDVEKVMARVNLYEV